MSKKKSKANLRYNKPNAAQSAKDSGKKQKMTFMQWVKVTPIWYVVFGVISLGASIYGLFHPDFFASDGEANRLLTLAVFFVLGAILLYLGARYLKDGEDLPENKLLKIFTRTK